MKKRDIIKIFSDPNEKLGNRPLLVAIRTGFTCMIPLLLIGSFALLIISLPLPGYQRMMNTVLGVGWQDVLLYVRDGTFNIMSLVMVICISYSYALEKRERHGYISPLIVATVALASFIAISGISEKNFSLSSFGTAGVFMAILVAVTSSVLFFKLHSIKALRMEAFTDGANAAFDNAIAAVLPAAITIVTFALINYAFYALLDIGNIQTYLSFLLCSVFYKMDSQFGSAILFIILSQLCWFLGMHGNNILEPVAQSVLVPALLSNQKMIAAGQAPTLIFSKTFLDTFVWMGGCGAALCFVLAVWLVGKYKNQRRLARLSLVPVLFNINELIVFGIPIVLNPVYLLPFLAVPVILAVTSYLATYWGLVPYTVNAVEWTTPIFLSGYVATGSIKGSLLQFFNLAIGILCYIPFIKLSEIVLDSHKKINLQKAYNIFMERESNDVTASLTLRHDDVGSIARTLNNDLTIDLQKGKMALFYQPQVDIAGRVVGGEALLRWFHDSYGYIYPPFIIALASESRLVDQLGFWILDTACSDLAKMNRQGIYDVTISVNISAVQLEDDNFAHKLEGIIRKYCIKPQNLQIEITEHTALSSGKKIFNQLMDIKKLGVKLAMDDFGMGHNSLMYLKEYNFDTIKLDGSLIKEIAFNKNCREIVSSIVSLGKSMGYVVVAEFVEEQSQIDILHGLGCDLYQGYFYRRAIPYPDFMAYLLTKNSCGENSAINE